jgi:NAD(P)-dependent dehydrogenase (short-subunit alcohol dehydrogenase family)
VTTPNGHGPAASTKVAAAAKAPAAANGNHQPVNNREAPPAPAAARPIVENLAASEPVIDRVTVTARLLEVVRDRTGYPIETLGLDLDIEADLGIDSIKRVEILGRIREEFPALKETADTADAMDELARARTLGLIVERMVAQFERTLKNRENAASQPSASTGPARLDHKTSPSAADSATVPERRVLEIVPAPIPETHAGLMPGGHLLITEDGRGVAESLLGRFEAAGIRATRIVVTEADVDWSSPAAVEAVIEQARREGPIAGIIHTLPLGQAASSAGDWRGRVDAGAKGLFLLAKAAANDLAHAAERGGACLIGTTALGGRLGCEGSSVGDFFAGHGAVLGLVKTLAREWPAVRTRCVDFAANEQAAAIAHRLLAEALTDDGWSEVGYDAAGRRVRVRSIEQALERTVSQVELKPGAPVVITGGARGITALGALELARRWRPTLLIVGKTPADHEAAPHELQGIVGEREIKSALRDRLLDQGLKATAAEIERAYQSVTRTREVRQNLALLREQGATVEYAVADVRDREALSPVMEGWRTRYGDPVGLIHGAGMIKDKLIRDKTIDAFDDVLGTKLEGALNVLGLVRPEALQFTAMFSSIAGRYGNVGQTDYAAANESLSKLAQWLDARWPGRVVSLIWGPWSGVGMVSQLEDHLGRRGLGMIAPEMGRSLLLDELRFGKKGQVEVIYSGGLGTLEDPLPVGPRRREQSP